MVRFRIRGAIIQIAMLFWLIVDFADKNVDLIPSFFSTQFMDRPLLSGWDTLPALIFLIFVNDENKQDVVILK